MIFLDTLANFRYINPMNLFDDTKKTQAPLADRIRPKMLNEFVGQKHLVGPGKPIRKAIAAAEIPSMVFWGPPGTGKTTLARIIATVKNYRFIGFSAVLSGVGEVRRIVKEAELYRNQGKRTILFIDEIHRFNKAQQDAFLPCIEKGSITLIGATTENPSFEVIAPLLSRTTVYVFNRLEEKDILQIIEHALKLETGLQKYKLNIDKATKEYLAKVADGDARVALNILEFATLTTVPKNGKRTVTLKTIQEAVKQSPLLYDKKGEEHYNLISAFIKSLRGSDPDAALYWLARMIDSGEDPLFIVRRMVIFAAEDIGNADPRALVIATACKEAVAFVGFPEGYLPLSQAVIYLATAPKCNTALTAYGKAMEDVKKYGSLPVPLHIRNPVTRLMEDIGYGKGYKYPHSYKGHWVKEDYLPDKLKGRKYYVPSDIGFEQEIQKRINKRGDKK